MPDDHRADTLAGWIEREAADDARRCGTPEYARRSARPVSTRPEVYGGAGVHVEYLARELRPAAPTSGSAASGAPRPSGRRGYPVPGGPGGRPTPRCRCSASTWRWPPRCAGADLVHSHTWYANFAGHVAKMLHGMPHVVTTHSLEPLRPWKAEQLGGGYTLSSWAERTALEARRRGHRGLGGDAARRARRLSRKSTRKRCTVIHNGIDTERVRARPRHRRAGAARHRPGRPYVVFVGRITRQKGLPHLLHAAGGPPTRRAAGALRRRARHPGDRRRGRRAGRRAAPRPATASSGSRRCCPAAR